jgi:hypothetical protein
MLLDLLHGIAEGWVGFGESHAIQNKSNGRHLKALQGIDRGKQLGTPGDPGLDDDDGTIDKAREIISLRGDYQRRGIGEYEVFLLHSGLFGNLLQKGC